jgi:sec-independent protein translocase protein TatC
MEEKRGDLVSHLAELRARVLRTVAYAIVGMVVVWTFYAPIYRLLIFPIERALKAAHGEIMVSHFMEGFMVRFEIAAVGGIILVAPLIYYELWAFIAPGLTGNERRAARPLVPVAGVLFLMGVGLAYLITEPSITWLLSMNPPDTVARYRLNENLVFMLKFYLAFGLSFQLPIVLILLAKIGLVNSRLLGARWREATVLIFIIAAVITPTWDPITMMVCALPMCGLYLGTVWVIRLIERGKQKAAKPAENSAG